MKRILTIALSLAFSLSAFAQQNARTAFFMNDYAYSYKFNPSFIPTKGHVSILGLGNTGASVESNVDGRMFKFVEHPAEEVVDEYGYSYIKDAYTTTEIDKKYIKADNKLNATVDMDLLSIGFRKGKFFHSIDLSLRADAGLRVPGPVLDVIADAIALGEDEEMDFTSASAKNIKIGANTYAELAYGLGWQLNDKLSVGARAKLLLGMAAVDVRFKNIDAQLNDDILSVNTDGRINLYMPSSVNVPVKDGHYDFDQLGEDDDFDVASGMPSGFGVAFDLGASYKIMDGLTASLSINDLGFIGWKNSVCGELGSFEINTAEEEEEDDDLIYIYPAGKGSMHGVTAKMNAAIEYEIPGAKGLSVGLLGTTRFAGLSSWSEGRLILTYEAPKVLSVAVSGAASNFGAGLGCALNLNLGPFGVFAGFDSLVPLFSLDGGRPGSVVNTNARFGLSIVFGRKQPKND